jgi:hypothetical protein
MPSQPLPEISVVIVAGSNRRRGANALASVLRQAGIERAEVILIDTALDRFPPLAGSAHPQVRVIQMGYEQHIGAMRIYAARVARAPLVAYLEEHALAMPGWLTGILAAFRQGEWAGVAGAVVPASPKPTVGTMVSMISFDGWTEEMVSRESDLMPGHNSAYRRDILLSLDNLLSLNNAPASDELEELAFIELNLQRRLRELGHKFYFDNRIKWIHLNENRIGSLFHDYFHWNVLFGQSRVQGRSSGYRVSRILTIPLILPVRVLKTLLQTRRRAGNDWTLYARMLPVALLVHSISMLGLGVGYLGGLKNSWLHLTIGELEVPREEPPRAYDIWHAQHHAENFGVPTDRK